MIIPAWNEAAFIGQSIARISAAMGQVNGHQGELIVVDNNSSDDTADIARAAGARVVFEGKNQIARARNAGAAAATGDALIFIDADSWCRTELLQASLDGLAAGTVIGGGSTIAPDRPVGAAARRGMNLWNRIGTTFRLAAGCFVYCRRDAFEAVGGFSVRVYAGEEIYLSRALKKLAKRRGMTFEILEVAPVVTSVRKLDWYSPLQLARQTAIVFIPGALYSKRLCRTWYDTEGRRDAMGDDREGRHDATGSSHRDG